jgi:cytochrome c biogenesis protein CcmG, thiol:disulfide interchange protein DsbE
MIKRLLPLIVFIGLAALLYAGVRMNSGRDTSAIPSPLIGKPAPDFALPAFGAPGRTVTQKDLRGKPYLINVWGSWCPNCRVEHPVVSALARTGTLRIVGYNYKDTPEESARWLQQFGNPYELIVVDEDGRDALDWGIYGAPESFIVDAAGIVRWKQVGPIDETIVREQIEPLVKAMEAGR